MRFLPLSLHPRAHIPPFFSPQDNWKIEEQDGESEQCNNRRSSDHAGIFHRQEEEQCPEEQEDGQCQRQNVNHLKY